MLLAGAGVGRTPQPNENCAGEVLSISVIVSFGFFNVRGISKLRSLTLARTKIWLFELSDWLFTRSTLLNTLNVSGWLPYL